METTSIRIAPTGCAFSKRPSPDTLQPPASDVSGFWGYQVIPVGPVTSIARANAAGVRHARAPLVALAEDHCFPEPSWAAALIAAHEGPWAVVGPAVRNANPSTVVSWCDFVVGYGPWMDPVTAGPARFLPGHNSCYKKAVLLAYGDRLDEMMEAETVLHFDLERRGYKLRLEPAARAAHTNFALASSWLPVMFHQGRLFGASRARAWGAARRLLYGAAGPLIPPVRLLRCLRELIRPGRPKHRIPRLLPMLGLGLVFDGIIATPSRWRACGGSISSSAGALPGSTKPAPPATPGECATTWDSICSCPGGGAAPSRRSLTAGGRRAPSRHWDSGSSRMRVGTSASD